MKELIFTDYYPCLRTTQDTFIFAAKMSNTQILLLVVFLLLFMLLDQTFQMVQGVIAYSHHALTTQVHAAKEY